MQVQLSWSHVRQGPVITRQFPLVHVMFGVSDRLATVVNVNELCFLCTEIEKKIILSLSDAYCNTEKRLTVNNHSTQVKPRNRRVSQLGVTLVGWERLGCGEISGGRSTHLT